MYLLAVPLDLDVRMKAVMIGAVFLIVSTLLNDKRLNPVHAIVYQSRPFSNALRSFYH